MLLAYFRPRQNKNKVESLNQPRNLSLDRQQVAKNRHTPASHRS